MLATCNAYSAHRHGSESPYPGSTPGLNPCNHLAWLACGPWRTHIQAWHEMVWYGMAWGLRPLPLPRPRRGHHRAGGAEAGEAEAGAAKAGAAAWSSEVSEARAGARAVVVGVGSPGDAGRERGSGATSGRQQQRGLVGRRSQGPSGSSGRASVQPTKLGREGPGGWNCRCAWRGRR